MEPTNEESISIDISALSTKLGDQMKNLRYQSSQPRSIFRVPKRLREVNSEAYTPKVISIGPFHHGQKELLQMEEHKLWYLQDLIRRFNSRLEDLVQYMKVREREVRQCYSEIIPLSSDDFSKMVLVDAAFIIGFMMRWIGKIAVTDDDPIFGIKTYICCDMAADLTYFLENQLPLFIIQGLATMIFGSADPGMNPEIVFVQYVSGFTKTFIGSKLAESTYERIKSCKCYHFVHMLSIGYQPLEGIPKRGEYKFRDVPSAVRLHQAGIEFKVRPDANLLEIQFSKGVLEMPTLKMMDDTENTFRNIIAFEQCHETIQNLTQYIIFLQMLVRTPKDAELLLEKKVILSGIGGPENVAKTIIQLHRGTYNDGRTFAYNKHCQELIEYCGIRRNKWKANLNRNYFNSPWTVISIIAASVILVLTFLQTLAAWMAL